MKPVSFTLILLALWMSLPGSHGLTADPKLPEIDGQKIVAFVNEEPITLAELNRAIAASHKKKAGDARAGRVDYSKIINRLINTRLILLEAQNMGLNELPEITSAVDSYARQLMMEILIERHVADIRVNDEEAQRVYRAAVREWKIKSARIKSEADAKKMESQLKDGRDFDEIMSKASKWGIVEADQGGEYFKNEDLALPVAQIISTMSIGEVSPVLSIGKKGFIIFKLEGMRIPEREDPKLRRSSRLLALNNKKVAAAKAYYSDIKKRYVKIYQERFDALDYESKTPGLDKLLQDQRVIAEIKEEKPITVGEFSLALKQTFYHGVDMAIENKKINASKYDVLENMLQKRVLTKEALKQGIDQTDAYKSRVAEYETSVIFGTFVQKVITPNIKLDVQELKTYYRENPDTYASPQMVRIRSIVFRSRNDAVAALKKLQRGTDFNWLVANADGQVDSNTKGLLLFDGRLLTLRGLPAEIQEIVSGARKGDFKLYQSPENHFYVLYLNQIVLPEPKPFEAVRGEIAKAVFDKKVKEAVEHWANQLRDYYPVEVHHANYNN